MRYLTLIALSYPLLAFDILNIPLPEPAARPLKVDRQPEGYEEDVCCDTIVPAMDRLAKPWRFCCGLCRPVNRRDEPFVVCSWPLQAPSLADYVYTIALH